MLISAVAIVASVVSGSLEETVASMTATFRNPRFSSPGTISKAKVKAWRVLGTSLAPAVTTVSSALPPENAFHEWPGAFIGASGNEQATLFLPFYYSSSPSPKYKIVAAYHIVPEKLVFSDLLSKAMLSRLPTLVPRTSIVVTNTSYSRFTLDDVLLVKPDIFVSSSIAIHGIDSPLDFTRNGGFGGGETDTSYFLVIATAIAIRYIRFLEFPH
ncbi:unnamed protein product [Thlaspi arvense]|uniref:FAS1 domain-containing protein n=1 Tax=Thlaspi arvense TaxID=13288 RepID=A0AAU9T3M2_THLAR|nr:unnamed protein product [Thlaspi arvense]